MAVVLIISHEANEIFDSALQEAAQRLLPLAADSLRERDARDQDGEDHPVAGFLQLAAHEEYLIYQLRNADGRVLLRSHDAPAAGFPAPLGRGFVDAEGLRFYTEAAPGGRLFLQVAEPLTHRWDVVREGFVWLLLPLLVLVPLAGLAIWWTVRRMTRPIRQAREAIRLRGGSNLAAIDPAGLPQELAPIIEDVNHLLRRLDQALEGERAFAANSAHELRTPVAAALAQAQRLVAELDGAPQHARAGQIVELLRRLGNLVEKLLQMARAEAGLALSREPLDLLPVVRLLVDELSRRPDGSGRIAFDAGGREHWPARADMDAFGIALRNVIENALAHGPRGGPVEVALDAEGALHVVNGGPPVPPDTLARLTRRFERGTATGEGSGIGLAIVETIMRQSGGSLALRSPVPGRTDGFEAVLRPA